MSTHGTLRLLRGSPGPKWKPSSLFWRPGYQAYDLTRGFATPPHDGCAFSRRGSSRILPWWSNEHVACQGGAAAGAQLDRQEKRVLSDALW